MTSISAGGPLPYSKDELIGTLKKGEWYDVCDIKGDPIVLSKLERLDPPCEDLFHKLGMRSYYKRSSIDNWWISTIEKSITNTIVKEFPEYSIIIAPEVVMYSMGVKSETATIFGFLIWKCEESKEVRIKLILSEKKEKPLLFPNLGEDGYSYTGYFQLTEGLLLKEPENMQGPNVWKPHPISLVADDPTFKEVQTCVLKELRQKFPEHTILQETAFLAHYSDKPLEKFQFKARYCEVEGRKAIIIGVNLFYTKEPREPAKTPEEELQNLAMGYFKGFA